jgi:hypothetical protein
MTEVEAGSETSRIKGTMDSIVPGLSRDPPRHKEYGGGGGGIRRRGGETKSRLRQTAFFIEVQPLNFSPEHTNVLLTPLIFLK